MTLVDSHCHLDFPDFADSFDDVLAHAHAQGVHVMQTICTKMTHFPQILETANRSDSLCCSVGIHPNEVESEPRVTTEEIIACTEHQKVVGIGETGLDFYYEHSPRAAQIASFRTHIEAAQRTKLPLIIHTRAADDETVELLQEMIKIAPFTGVLHCFTGGYALAKAALEMGLYISISGIVTFKKAEALQAIVKEVPLSRILVETDSPYLAPVPHRGKRNEPAFTRYTAEYVATLKDVAFEEVASTTTANFFRLFTKAASLFPNYAV